jgi:hypothetical protein
MTLTEVTTFGGLAGLTASVVLLAWQTRAVAQQATINNAIAGASVMKATVADLREVLLLFVERPGLRAYFYECKNAPRSRSQHSRVVATAEIFGDVLESGLVANRLVSASGNLDAWTNYCCQVLATSPVLYGLSRKHPEWWPQLARLEPRPPCV